MRLGIFFFTSLGVVFALYLQGCQTDAHPDRTKHPGFITPKKISDGPAKPDPADFAERVAAATAFARKSGLDTRVAIFVDLGLHSGNYRCFVVRLPDGAIRAKGLVTHGSGKTGLSAGERAYSNVEGSYLSSLGKYKTGVSYNGQFGLAYKLHGYDESNSNAYKRYIVLHGHECVPDNESDDLICQSWGCPTVSRSFLKRLQSLIDNSDKPLLVWIFDSTREKAK
jgi:hypothetical protein